MATMIPDLSDHQLADITSQAELKVYRSLRESLPNDYMVLNQVKWILRMEDERAKDGEIDFLVCHPDHGYLCIEVKGGGVEYDGVTGKWFSIDRYQNKNEIKDPMDQALRAKFSIRNKLKEHQRWQKLALQNVIKGHAVFFPDVGNPDLMSSPKMPKELIGCSRDLKNARDWVDGAFACWRNKSTNWTPLGKKGLEVIRDVFARSFVALPLISAQLAEQEARRLQLTQEQIHILDFLRSRRRVAVSGGAGTGKTVLAVEKARRLAQEGFNTLLTCYNRPLADHLASVCKDWPNLDVMSFHQLCYRFVKRAKEFFGRDLLGEAYNTYPGKDRYDVLLPNALAFSLEIIPDRYDAIVCDEGQDFGEEYWMPLELLLSDYEKSPMYIFFDDNQNIYSRVGTFPIRDEPFSLSVNCRNTFQIHVGAYKYYKGLPVDAPDNLGNEIQLIKSVGQDQQARKTISRIVELIDRQRVSPKDIVVLIADAQRKSDCYSILKSLPLPRPAYWCEEGVRDENTILIDTINRFKGLESPIVIIWGLDTLDLSKHQEVLYVGMSRAKSLLIIVGKPETFEAFGIAEPFSNLPL